MTQPKAAVVGSATLPELQEKHARTVRKLWETNDHFTHPGMMSSRRARWLESVTRAELVALVGTVAVNASEA